MAVKVSAEVTVTDVTDAKDIVTWYQLLSSATKPSKPTTTDSTVTPTPGEWTKTEPSFDPSQGTRYLYTCQQLVWGDNSCSWGDVQRSSSYEQAKAAWNAANAAQETADSIEIGGRNLLAWSDRKGETAMSSSGLSWTHDADGWITVTGTISSSSAGVLLFWGTTNTSNYVYPANTYTVTVENDGLLAANVLRVQVGYDGTTYKYLYDSGSVTFAAENGISRVCLYRYGANGTAVNGRIRFKMEKGNKPTDWTPAPEDQTVYVDSSVESIQIGGRNLLRETEALSDTSWWKRNAISSIATGQTDPDGGTSAVLITPSSTSWYLSADNHVLLTNVGEIYTASIWLKAASATTCNICMRYLKSDYSDGTTATSTSRMTVSLTTSWQRFSLTGTLTAAQTADCFWIGQKSSVAVYAYHPKLEKGNKPTDWTPAPEDTDAAIAAKADATEGIEYIVGTHGTTATGTWTGTTKDAALYVGKQIAYYLTSNGVSGTASTLNLTLSGGGTTGAKNVRLNNTNVTNHYPANTILKLTYDGTYWKCDNYNSDTYDRENYKVALAASSAISAGRIAVVGTDGKLKLLAASAFDYTKPILYVGTAYSATNVTDGTTRTSNYTFWGTAFNLTNTHAIAGAAAGKAVYIVGTLSGTTFTPNSTVLTCTTPTSANGLVYLRLGIMSTASNAVLESDHPLYMYHNGAFQPCDPATVASAKTATNYISLHPTDGIKIANANPETATTYQHQTATSTDFVVDGDSVLKLDGTNGARIGKADENHIGIDSDSIDFMNDDEYLGAIQASDIDGVGATTALVLGGSDLETSVHGYRTASHRHVYIHSKHSFVDEDTGLDKEAVADVCVRTWLDGRDSTHWASAIDLNAESVSFQDPSNTASLQLGKPTSLYSTGSVSVANSSWVKVAQLTIPSTGTWLVVLSGDFASNANGRRLVACARGAVPSSAPSFDSQNSLAMAPANGANTKFSSSAIIDFDAGDVYYAAVWQNSGGALTTRIMIKAVRLI